MNKYTFLDGRTVPFPRLSEEKLDILLEITASLNTINQSTRTQLREKLYSVTGDQSTKVRSAAPDTFYEPNASAESWNAMLDYDDEDDLGDMETGDDEDGLGDIATEDLETFMHDMFPELGGKKEFDGTDEEKRAKEELREQLLCQMFPMRNMDLVENTDPVDILFKEIADDIQKRLRIAAGVDSCVGVKDASVTVLEYTGQSEGHRYVIYMASEMPTNPAIVEQLQDESADTPIIWLTAPLSQTNEDGNTPTPITSSSSPAVPTIMRVEKKDVWKGGYVQSMRDHASSNGQICTQFYELYSKEQSDFIFDLSQRYGEHIVEIILFTFNKGIRIYSGADGIRSWHRGELTQDVLDSVNAKCDDLTPDERREYEHILKTAISEGFSHEAREGNTLPGVLSEDRRTADDLLDEILSNLAIQTEKSWEQDPMNNALVNGLWTLVKKLRSLRSPEHAALQQVIENYLDLSFPSYQDWYQLHHRLSALQSGRSAKTDA